MKRFWVAAFFILLSAVANAQEEASLISGQISFMSSRNVYVKFTSTDGINIGDTLFLRPATELIPALIVENKSSSSTVCKPLPDLSFEKGMDIFANIPTPKKAQPKEEDKEEEEEDPEDDSPPTAPTTVIVPEEDPYYQEDIRGRVSAASYSNFNDYEDRHRMRYAFNFRGNNINYSRFSVDSYITFRHTLGEWADVQENLGNALKVYSLAGRFDIDSTSSVTLGRKINPKISSIGAIDGLQYEKYFGRFVAGAVGGSRPDFTNYGVNFSLFQVGGYVGFVSNDPGKYSQSTLGFMEQHNGANVDRRFVYFQHSGNIFENLNVFSSFEVDLYQNIPNESTSTFSLTNLYVSLRYRFTRNIRASIAYDNRKRIIYYESYKSFIDQLIEDETRQGLRVNLNIRPIKYISVGVNGSLRFQNSGANPSRNLNIYASISRIPGIEARATLNANLLETGYLDSRILGCRIAKEVIDRKMNAEVYYRWVDYHYKSSDTNIQQNIFGASLSFQIMKKLGLYLYYEGVFDQEGAVYTRVNTKLIQRF